MNIVDIILVTLILLYIGYVLFNFNHFNDDQCSSNCRTCNLVDCKNANPLKRRENNKRKLAQKNKNNV